MQRSKDSPLDAYAVRLARKKVARLVGSYGLTGADRTDLEQELLLEILRRLPRFDPARGKCESFVGRVVEHAAISIVAQRKAACRDWRRNAGSLDDLVRDADGRRVPVWRTLDAQTVRAHRGADDDGDARADLRIDLAAAVATLPPDLQATCAHLACGSVRGGVRASGMPRRTMRARVARIRARFEALGLTDYLPDPAPTCATSPVCQQQGRAAAAPRRTA